MVWSNNTLTTLALKQKVFLMLIFTSATKSLNEKVILGDECCMLDIIDSLKILSDCGLCFKLS